MLTHNLAIFWVSSYQSNLCNALKLLDNVIIPNLLNPCRFLQIHACCYAQGLLEVNSITDLAYNLFESKTLYYLEYIKNSFALGLVQVHNITLLTNI